MQLFQLPAKTSPIKFVYSKFRENTDLRPPYVYLILSPFDLIQACLQFRDGSVLMFERNPRFPNGFWPIQILIR
jgi:hypothetical protein